MSAYLPHRARLRTLLGLADSAAFLLALWLAYALRFQEFRTLKWQELLGSPFFLFFAWLAGVAVATAAELYEPEILYRRVELAVRVVVAMSLWAMVIALATYMYPSWAFGRGVLFLTALTWSAIMIATRWRMTSWMRQRSRFTALVIGDQEAVGRFCESLGRRPSSPWKPVDGSHLVAADIPRAIDEQEASLVVLAGGYERALEMGDDLAKMHFSGVPVVASSEIWAWLEERLPLEALTPAIFLHQPGFGAVHWTLFNRVTRIADIVASLTLLVASSPLLILGALAVWVSDGRPILYRQERLGQYGRSFWMVKLRTMRVDAEKFGPEFAQDRDPRSTRVGHFLRRFRIDELPQVWNVLKGEMSLVGPRPERPEFVAELTQKIPYYAFRMAVPPGLTGWAQVNTAYARELADHRRKLEFDLYFIRERSVRLYVLTLLRTFSAALVGVRRAKST